MTHNINQSNVQIHFQSNLQLITKSMNINLKGKTALVTGSVGGIGVGIAKALVAAGSNIILNGFNSDEVIEDLKKQLKTPDNKVEYIYADLQKTDDTKELIKRGIKMFGGIDILVNNAGKQHTQKLVDFPDKTWDEIMNLNLNACYYTTKAVLPHMIKQRWGRIVNIAGVHGLVASVNKSANIASKHGLIGLTKATALENAEFGITANAICPAFVFTPLIESQVKDKAKSLGIPYQQAKDALIRQKIPSGLACNTEDIGELVLFLVSQFANEMNGGTYTMDGGWTAQ